MTRFIEVTVQGGKRVWLNIAHIVRLEAGDVEGTTRIQMVTRETILAPVSLESLMATIGKREM